MLKALLWKEWREQRPLALTGLCLAVLLPFLILAGGTVLSRETDLSGVFEVYLVLVSGLLWPLFAAAAGASTVAGEIGDGTLGFLLSRPVSRTRLWMIKTMMACGALLLIVAGSVAIALGLSRLAASPTSGPLLDLLFSLRGDFYLTLAFGLLVLPLTCSIFFSTLISRPLTAAAAGVATSLAVLLGSLWVWWRLDPSPWSAQLGPALQIGLTGALTLLASSLVFSRGELLQGLPLRRAGWIAAALVAVGTCSVTLLLAFAKVHLIPARAVVGEVEMSPGGDRVVATAFFDYPRSPRIWMVRTDGSGGALLTGTLASAPHFSPRGDRLVYYSQRSLLGFRTGRQDLRVMRPDGSEDQVLVPDLASLGEAFSWQYPGPVFSPEGERVALSNGEILLIVHLGSRNLASYPLQSAPFRGGRLLGWSPDGRELFFKNPTRGKDEGVVLGAFRLEDRSARIFYRQPAPAYVPWSLQSGRSVTRIPLIAKRRKGADGFHEWELSLVDPASGISLLLTTRGCPFCLSQSRDGNFAAYAEWIRTRDGRESTRISLRDLSEGNERVVGELPGRAIGLEFSLDGKKLLVRRLPVPGSRDTILDLQGNIQELEPGWRALDWTAGNGRVVMGRLNAENHVTALGVFEARTGKMHPLPTGLRLQ